MGRPTAILRRRPDRGLVAVYGAVLLAQASSAAALPILPELQVTFGISAVAVALTTTVWGLARLVTDLPGGILTERVRPGRMLVAGALLAAGGSVVSALAPTFWLLLGGQAVAGMGSALMAIAAVITLMARTNPRRRGRTLGLYNASLQAGSTLSPAVAGVASAIWGWQAAFMVAAGLSLAGAAFYVVWSRPGATIGSSPSRDGLRSDPGIDAGPTGPEIATPPEADDDAPIETSTDTPTDMPKRPRPLLVAAVDGSTFALFFVTGAAVQTAVPLFGGTVVGLGPATIGLVLGFATLLRFGISLGGAELSDRFGRRRILVPGLAACVVALVAFPSVEGLAGFAVATSLLAVGRVGNGVPLALLGDHLGAARLGTAVGRNRFVADLALVVGPVTAGLLIERAGFAVAFPAIAVVVVVAAVVVVVEWTTGRSGPAVAGGAGQAPGV